MHALQMDTDDVNMDTKRVMIATPPQCDTVAVGWLLLVPQVEAVVSGSFVLLVRLF